MAAVALVRSTSQQSFSASSVAGYKTSGYRYPPLSKVQVIPLGFYGRPPLVPVFLN